MESSLRKMKFKFKVMAKNLYNKPTVCQTPVKVRHHLYIGSVIHYKNIITITSIIVIIITILIITITIIITITSSSSSPAGGNIMGLAGAAWTCVSSKSHCEATWEVLFITNTSFFIIPGKWWSRWWYRQWSMMIVFSKSHCEQPERYYEWLLRRNTMRLHKWWFGSDPDNYSQNSWWFRIWQWAFLF